MCVAKFVRPRVLKMAFRTPTSKSVKNGSAAPLLLILLCSSLYISLVSTQAVGNPTANLNSIDVVNSCSLFSSKNGPSLQCQNNNVTLFDLSIPVNYGASFEWPIRILASANQFSSTSDTNPQPNFCSGATCLLTQDVRLRVEVSSSPLAYTLTQIKGLNVAWANPAFHSNNYQHQKTKPERCTPYSTYENTGALEYRSATDNKLFTEGANINNGVCNTHFTSTFDEQSYISSTCDGLDGDFQGNPFYHAEIKSKICGAYAPNAFRDKFYGMVWNQQNSYMVLPTNDKPLRFKQSGSDTWSTFGSGTINQNAAKTFATDYDPDAMNKNSCNKIFGYISDISPCRVFAGNHFYQGPLQWNKENWAYPPGSTQYGISLVRPVMIGVRQPYFGGFQWPVSPTNDQSSARTYKSPVASAGTWREDFGRNYCSADDDHCCDGYVRVDYSVTDNPTDKATGAVPVTICQTVRFDKTGPTGCNPDRFGLANGFDTLHNAANDYHMTAEAMGVLGPMCYVNQVQTTPQLVYTVKASLIDAAGNTIASETKRYNHQGVVQPTSAEGDSQTEDADNNGADSQSANSKPNVGTLSLISILSAVPQSNTGEVGQEMAPSYVIVCNTTQENGLLYQGDLDALGNPTNPWPNIYNQRAMRPDGNVPGSPIDSNVCPLNNVQVPLAQCIPNKPATGKGVPNVDYNPFAWFHMVGPDRLNHYCKTCGCLGVDLRVMGDINTQQYVCSKGRYACSANYLDALSPLLENDFTLNDRLRSYLNLENASYTDRYGITWSGAGAYENYLRSYLPKASPAVVAGYLYDYAQTDSFTTFEALRAPQGFLPPGWVSPSGADGVTYPNIWIDGPHLYNSDRTILAPNLAFRLSVAVAGEALVGQGSLTGGTFTSPDPSKPNQITCIVQLGGSGTAQMNIYNPYEQAGLYSVGVNCSTAIMQASDVSVALGPKTQAPVRIGLKHSGLATTVQCQFRLFNPGYPTFTLDQTPAQDCIVAVVTSANASVTGMANFIACDKSKPNCGIPGISVQPDVNKKSSWFSIAWAIILVILNAAVAFVLGSAISVAVQ